MWILEQFKPYEKVLTDVERFSRTIQIFLYSLRRPERLLMLLIWSDHIRIPD
jgi:hypothetical protein